MGGISVLDLIFVLPILWGMYKGFKDGFVKQLAGITSWIVGFFVASNFVDMMDGILSQFIEINQKVLHIGSFILIFVLVALLINWVGNIFNRILVAIQLGFANRIFGLVAKGSIYTLIMGLLFWGISFVDDQLHFLSDDLKDNSLTYPIVVEHYPRVFEFFNLDFFEGSSDKKNTITVFYPNEN